MKSAIILFGLSLLLTTASLSQAVPDSTARRNRERQRSVFVDENGDGINDWAQQRKGRMKQQKDRFIDANGDGICDSRESGLGFRRGAASGHNNTGKLSGKKGRGGKK
jgi:hypothetical protein